MKSPAPDNPLLYVGMHTARDLDTDLIAAGIDKRAFGGKLYFHSLRTLFVTLLFECRARVQEVQSLARHSIPSMTLNTYGRTREGRLPELAEALGRAVFTSKSTTEAVREKATA